MRKVGTTEKYFKVSSQEIFQEQKNKFEQADYLLIFEYTELYNLEDRYLDSNVEIKLVNVNHLALKMRGLTLGSSKSLPPQAGC